MVPVIVKGHWRIVEQNISPFYVESEKILSKEIKHVLVTSEPPKVQSSGKGLIYAAKILDCRLGLKILKEKAFCLVL